MRSSRLGLAGLLAIAHPLAVPDDAEGTCRVRDAVIYARREDHGLQWYLARPGRPALSIGWGYEGEPVCAAGYQRGRYLIAYGFFDPWGGWPEVHTVAVDGDRIAARRDRKASCLDPRPAYVEPRAGRWLLGVRCGDDGPIDERELRLGRIGTLYKTSNDLTLARLQAREIASRPRDALQNLQSDLAPSATHDEPSQHLQIGGEPFVLTR